MDTTTHATSPGVGTVRLVRLVWVGPLAVAASIAAVLAVRVALVALLKPPAEFTPLGWDSPIVLTGVLVTCACLVFLLVTRLSSSPIRTYRVVALVALMLSLLPDALLIRSGEPGATWPNALALSALHLVAWAVSTWMLTRLTVASHQLAEERPVTAASRADGADRVRSGVPIWCVRASTDTALSLSVLVFLFCAGLTATSTIRRVGDGAEYWAMAEQLAGFRPPSASPEDLVRLEAEAKGVGHGFETSRLRFPKLVAADGHQDFPHCWLYPLVTVPALWLTRAADAHPNWAFTATNGILLSAAFFIVSTEVSVTWAVLVLVGPLIWWIDKAHGEIFTVSLLAAGCALWRRAPDWTLVLVALAAAQNPALMPVWGVVACVVVLHAAGMVDRPAWSRTPLKLAASVLAGAAILAVFLAYYRLRLHVWSPLLGYTHATWPSGRTVLTFLADPNIGLVPNMPMLAGAIAWTIAMAWRWRRASPGVWTDWLLAVGAWVLLLAAFTESVNLNHGATPGLNRWTLWLMPWLLVVAPAWPADSRIEAGRGTAIALMLLAVMNTGWSLYYFRPGLPESYRYPTQSAAWLWTHAPAWYSPAAEVFAERVSHREPAIVPTAWEGCAKVLVVNNEWPAPCLPPAQPPTRCGPSRMCYATWSNGAVEFTPLSDEGFPRTLAQQRWSAAEGFVANLRDRIEMGQVGDPDLRPRAVPDSGLRVDGIAWASVWMGSSTIAIYLDRVSPGAIIYLRVPLDYHGELIDLENGSAPIHVDVLRSGQAPAALVVRSSLRHALLWLRP